MKIEFIPLKKRQTLEDFAIEHGLTMLVEEMGKVASDDADAKKRKMYRATFKNVYLSNGAQEYGYGTGRVEHAIRAYGKKISGKTLKYQGSALKVPDLILWPKKKSNE